MCNFFSFCSDGKGQYLYFNWEQRKKILAGEIKVESADSHTSIADFYGWKGKLEDKLNKYEYNPLTKIFNCDKINIEDDREYAESFVKNLDFKTIVEPLIIKPIIHPFNDIKFNDEINEKHIALIKQWASVWASVWDSVGASVGASVWDSVGASVGASVRASVWDSVRASVWASVGDSVGASVGASVRASVWDSVWAYISSFFDIKYKYNSSSCVQLWEMGLVPSFDGKTWRLHSHKGIVWEGKI